LGADGRRHENGGEFCQRAMTQAPPPPVRSPTPCGTPTGGRHTGPARWRRAQCAGLQGRPGGRLGVAAVRRAPSGWGPVQCGALAWGSPQCSAADCAPPHASRSLHWEFYHKEWGAGSSPLERAAGQRAAGPSRWSPPQRGRCPTLQQAVSLSTRHKAQPKTTRNRRHRRHAWLAVSPKSPLSR